MRFKIIYQSEGEIKKEIVESESVNQLEKEYPNIISYKKLYMKKSNKKASLEDYSSFFHEFSTLLASNITLIESIRLLRNNNYSKPIEMFLDDFLFALENGTSVYTKINENNTYPAEIYYFIKNCEDSGEYYKNMKALSDIFGYKKSIQTKLIKLFWYPVFLLVSLTIAIFFMMFVVLPEFEYIFVQFNNKLPFTTQILLDIKYFIESYLIIIFGLFAMAVIFILYLSQKYRVYFDKVLYQKIPFVSGVYRDYLHYQFFLIVSISLESNNKITDVFSFIEDSFSNQFFNSKIRSINKYIQNGELFYNAFKEQKVFDYYILRLLYIGDNANEYTKTFKNLVSITLSKVDKKITLFTKISEPLLLLFIGVFLLIMILGVLSPVWEFSKIG